MRNSIGSRNARFFHDEAPGEAVLMHRYKPRLSVKPQAKNHPARNIFVFRKSGGKANAI
jgi:hypothetical protein